MKTLRLAAPMQPDYFAPSHYPLLTQLCRHVVASNRVAMLVEQCCKQKSVNSAELKIGCSRLSRRKARLSFASAVSCACRISRSCDTSRANRARSQRSRFLGTVSSEVIRLIRLKRRLELACVCQNHGCALYPALFRPLDCSDHPLS